MKDTDPFYNYFLYDDDGKVAQQGIIVYSPDQPTSITLKMKPDTRYKLVAADPNNCLTTLGTYSLGFPVFAIDTSIAFVRNDACGQKTGAVVGLHVIGADDPRYMKYTWTDETGKVVGQFLQLTSVGAGTYTLNVLAVNGGCTDSKTFTITDDVINALAPSIDNLKMCLPGVALLSVTDVDGTGGYNLYDASNNLIISNQFGKFAVDVKETTDYYVAHTVGTCESPKTKVTVTVDLPNVEIPNTFTPNNDGVNDFWNIKGLEQFPNVTVDIYTRYGQLVYHSAGYARPFDGTTAKQKILPVGAYYYVIDVHKPVCLGKIAGNITIIR
jgi:gliding motility-associated-like protein